MILGAKMISKIHYKGNNCVWRDQRSKYRKARTKVPEREINVIQNWSLGHTIPYTNHCHKDIGRSNICKSDVTIMVAQYEKGHHIKYKGAMATNEQGGSMINNQS